MKHVHASANACNGPSQTELARPRATVNAGCAAVTPTTFEVVAELTWWAAEAARLGTDWPSVISTAFEMMILTGVVEQADTMCAAWDAASWREAAVEYHRNRAGRLAMEIEPKRLAQLRLLVADHVSLDRAWNELNDTRKNSEANFRRRIAR